ncbi:hypothetical protein GQ600_8633 [Phytophthora cactorum]|nr:hypothetical protein GQ600_8632 [Phytophthora cactorum]KAF1773023.1 hypothetical protein GQ600_8633 [Phytophthora cactorum]
MPVSWRQLHQRKDAEEERRAPLALCRASRSPESHAAR